MSVPVSTKTSRKPNLDLEDGIEYPSSDGKPMGETGTHARVAMVSIYGVLDRYFMNNPRVAVHANMFMYYVQGDPKRNVCPDAFVAMGVPNEPDRRSYKVWKEGKGARRGVRSDLEEDSQAGSDEEVRDLPGCPAGSRVLPLRPLRGVSRPIVAGIPSGCRELRADPHDQGRDAERGSRAGAPAG